MLFIRLSVYCIVFMLLTLWGCLNYHWQQQQVLDFTEHKTYQVIGIIDSLPEYKNHHVAFVLKLTEFNKQAVETHLQLNWYGKTPELHIGETWQLMVKLRQPSSIPIRNDFDYGAWLKQHGLQALGYVSTNPSDQKLKPFSGWSWRYRLDQMRANIDENIHQTLKNSPYLQEAALISGLTVGIRTAMTPQQWSDFENTGTVHLMAIAGLHIGFCAAFIFFATNWLWSRSEKLTLSVPSQTIGAISALISALIYAAMAGFALPTQRAFIMLSVLTLAKLSNRNISTVRSLALAAVLILLWDPLAIMSASFWLSFSAVALIFYGIQGRINSQENLWQRWGQIQWVLSVGLTPFTLWFFQQASLSGLLANLLAIPIVGFVAIPLCLIGCIFLGINQSVAHALLLTAAFVLHYLMKVLGFLAFMPYAVWHFSLSNFSEFLALLLAFVLILAPRGLSVRWLGGLLLICVLLS